MYNDFESQALTTGILTEVLQVLGSRKSRGTYADVQDVKNKVHEIFFGILNSPGISTETLQELAFDGLWEKVYEQISE